MEWTQSREGDLGLGGTCAVCFLLACLLCMLSVSALCLCQLYFLLHRAVVSTRPTLSLPMARGKYCLRSSCCACQAFRPYACMPACICCCLCLHLPICSRKKKCPLLPLRAVLHELIHVFCFAKFPLE